MKTRVDLEKLEEAIKKTIFCFSQKKGDEVIDFLEKLESAIRNKRDPFYDSQHPERHRAQKFAEVGSYVVFGETVACVQGIGPTDWTRYIKTLDGKKHYVHIIDLGYPKKPLVDNR